MKINDHIMTLIIRQLSRQSSQADDLHIREWLAQSQQNQEEFEKIVAIWNASAAMPPKSIDVDYEWNQFRNRHFTPAQEPRVIRLTFSRLVRYAAAAVVVIGLALGSIYISGSQTYATGMGQRLQVSLDDGTQIILGESSQLNVPRTFNWFKRNIHLSGEGFFEVAKNPDKPFKIEGPLTNTQVLGTAFQLIATQGENMVKVSEGKVAYWDQGGKDTLILTHGEKGDFTDHKLVESQIANPSFDSWKTGEFVFENEKVSDVLRSLQNYYVFSIINLDKYDKLDCRFSGKFDHQSLEDVLDELAMTMGMEYTFENSTLRITKFYCE